jgi:hypothetical protein
MNSNSAYAPSVDLAPSPHTTTPKSLLPSLSLWRSLVLNAFNKYSPPCSEAHELVHGADLYCYQPPCTRLARPGPRTYFFPCFRNAGIAQHAIFPTQDNPRIHVVSHADIWSDPATLPSFNSAGDRRLSSLPCPFFLPSSRPPLLLLSPFSLLRFAFLVPFPPLSHRILALSHPTHTRGHAPRSPRVCSPSVAIELHLHRIPGVNRQAHFAMRRACTLAIQQYDAARDIEQKQAASSMHKSSAH